jgi:hypothetical protein
MKKLTLLVGAIELMAIVAEQVFRAYYFCTLQYHSEGVAVG